MYKKIFDLVFNVEFESACQQFELLSDEEKYDLMEKMAYDTDSMLCYAFINYVNEKNECVINHEIAFNILSNPLCYIEGAYHCAYFHCKRLLELYPESIKYLEWMMIFYGVGTIDKSKTLEYCKRLLKLDSNNAQAIEMLKMMK
jgi:hypothetical protein